MHYNKREVVHAYLRQLVAYYTIEVQIIPLPRRHIETFGNTIESVLPRLDSMLAEDWPEVVAADVLCHLLPLVHKRG